MKAAIYTRFSSDRQREASSEDQARNCRRRIEAEGWTLVEHFKDEAITGSTSARPGYQKLLKAAERREFAVLLVDDLSRLSRDQVESERVIRRLEFGGVRIIGVSDGYDSQSKSRKIQRGVRGMMNELYLDDLKEKTHRGLEGQALKQFWAGGRPYGYKLVRIKDGTRLDAYGEPLALGTRLEIDPETDTIVNEIFRRYADGWSPRAIADELNRRGIPSPGSTWRNRTVRRISGWLGSAVKAILGNELYVGEYVWNKTAWVKDPDTGNRRVLKRPKSEWVRSRLPELQIVPDEIWQRVQARHVAAAAAGGNIREGIKRAGHRAGRNPAYLFSSLLKCGLCGANLCIIGGQGIWKSYGCATRKEGGPHACSNALTVRLSIVEDRLLAPIKNDLLSEDVIAEFRRRVAKAIAAKPAEKSNDARIAQLRAEVSNLTDAIAGGVLRTSKALADRLAAGEAELERLICEKPARKAQIVNMPAQLVDRYRRLVAGLEVELSRDVHRARTMLRQLVGSEIPVVPHESGKHLVARIGLDLAQLVQASGSSEIFMVAGAGFEPATFGL
jgi:site-specific DNA recombinase